MAIAALIVFLLNGWTAHASNNGDLQKPAAAQERVVSGRVLDIQEQPIVGASVVAEGSSKGVTTDDDGRFTLSIPQGTTALNVRFMGYVTKTEPITSSQTDLTIYLQEDVIGLETAVVVGYGTQKRVNLTGAVSVVTGAELEDRVTPTVTAMLQGAVPGLN
ncbi:MAG TPA: carboxypeptidase-like regulatory domain-containing protein, partial [Parapedobacter sp.]|nr:carboxypeptidase-like regulatory domain-containing protein [Parapedobacter sp.]